MKPRSKKPNRTLPIDVQELIVKYYNPISERSNMPHESKPKKEESDAGWQFLKDTITPFVSTVLFTSKALGDFNDGTRNVENIARKVGYLTLPVTLPLGLVGAAGAFFVRGAKKGIENAVESAENAKIQKKLRQEAADIEDFFLFVDSNTFFNPKEIKLGVQRPIYQRDQIDRLEKNQELNEEKQSKNSLAEVMKLFPEAEITVQSLESIKSSIADAKLSAKQKNILQDIYDDLYLTFHEISHEKDNQNASKLIALVEHINKGIKQLLMPYTSRDMEPSPVVKQWIQGLMGITDYLARMIDKMEEREEQPAMQSPVVRR